MLVRLVRPVKRKGSSNHHFVQRIPIDLRERAVGLKLEVPVGPEIVSLTLTTAMQAVRLSLRTSSHSEAKARQGEVVAYLSRVWEALRSDTPLPLSHRQAVALAGDLYRAWADDEAASPDIVAVEVPGTGRMRLDLAPGLGAGEGLASMALRLRDTPEEDLEQVLGPIANRLLLRKGIARLAPISRTMVLNELRKALAEALDVRSRYEAGDYSADPAANRFPEWKAPKHGKVSLTGLVEDWWKEAKQAGRQVSTYESYKATFERLRAFLRHDDASTVTQSDIVRFKDHRVAQGVKPKTVSDSDLAAMRSVLGWAVRNLKLPSNPAAEVRMVRAIPVRTRSKSLTLEEAAAVLKHSQQAMRGKDRPKTHAAKRWVPWLCAYTGARLGEMVQLRKQDLRREGDGWVITITPEAGRVKDKEVREVVLHAHLVELGFPAFVEAAPAGHLFLNSKAGEDSRGVWRSVKNRVTEFVREVVTDPAVRPNHGWRHLFKTRGREAGIEDSVLDAICGHRPPSVGAGYGEVTLRAQREAMARFPRFPLEPGQRRANGMGR